MSQTRAASILFATISLLSISLIDPVHAQNLTLNDSTNYAAKIDELDDLLIISLPAVFISGSLTGSAFLLHMLKNAEENKKIRMQHAKDNFIRAFIMFLICVISIFSFDFIEIMSERLHIWLLILDVVITYGVFGIGLMFLVKAARQIYGIM